MRDLVVRNPSLPIGYTTHVLVLPLGAAGHRWMGEFMSPEAKRLKLSGIVALIVGCACVIAGVVLTVLGVDITDLFVIAASVVALLVGARGARVANVPSNAPKLMVPSTGATVATGALCAGDVAFANGQVLPIVVGAVAFVLALLVTIATLAVKRSVEKV